MSEKSMKYGDIYNLHGLDLPLEDINFRRVSIAYLKRNNITTLQHLLSMNSHILMEEVERNYTAIDDIEETLHELSDDSEHEARHKEQDWFDKDDPMVAVAVNYMKLLGLSDEIIEAFEKRGQVKVSNQVCVGIDPDGDESDEIRRKGSYVSYKGMLFSLSTSEPTEWQMLGFYLLYHVNRLEISGRAMYTIFCVDPNEHRWEYDEQDILNGEPWVYVTYVGDENWEWTNYVNVPVESVMGYVFRTDLPTYKEETLRFLEGPQDSEMKGFLRSRPDILSRTNCAKIVAFSPFPLELKIPVLELIAEQTEPCPEDEEYDPLIAVKAFRIALDERYSNSPPGTVFLLHEHYANRPSTIGCDDIFWRIYTDFDTAVECIVNERVPQLREVYVDCDTWYEIAKCVPTECGEKHSDISWIIDAAGDIISFDSSTKFLIRHGFLREPDPMLGEILWDIELGAPNNLDFFRGCIDIPTPFKPGDIVWRDRSPLSKLRHVVISSNDGEIVMSINMHNEKVFGSGLESIYDRLSPLYRAWAVSEMIYDNYAKVDDSERSAMKTISAAIKANPDIGIEMEKYLFKDWDSKHKGVKWEDFKEKFGLTERTDTE